MDSLKLLLALAVLVVVSTLDEDLAFGGIEMGDGIIEINELSISSGSGFTNGETITITQQGATPAAGTFTNLGEIDSSELTILVTFSGFASQSVTLTQESTTAQGFWTDFNSDTNVDNGEVTVTEEGVLFENGQILIVANISQETIATANFVDSQDDVINDGELKITNGGSGFVDGTVVLSGNSSPGVTTAQFTDTNIACLVPNSGDWTVTSDCTLFSNETAPANVIVQSNTLVTIPNGVTLDIDFTIFNLTIKSGSGILIESGGKIT